MATDSNPTQDPFLHEKSHGHKSLQGYSPWGCKVSDMIENTCKCPSKGWGAVLVPSGGLLASGVGVSLAGGEGRICRVHVDEGGGGDNVDRS